MLDTELRDLLQLVEKDLTEYEKFETIPYYICVDSDISPIKLYEVIPLLIEIGVDNIPNFNINRITTAFQYALNYDYTIEWYNQQKLNHIRLAIELLNKKIEANV